MTEYTSSQLQPSLTSFAEKSAVARRKKRTSGVTKMANPVSAVNTGADPSAEPAWTTSAVEEVTATPRPTLSVCNVDFLMSVTILFTEKIINHPPSGERLQQDLKKYHSLLEIRDFPRELLLRLANCLDQMLSRTSLTVDKRRKVTMKLLFSVHSIQLMFKPGEMDIDDKALSKAMMTSVLSGFEDYLK